MRMLRVLSIILCGLSTASFAVEKPMTDDQIRHILVQGSISEFPGECPCPFSTDAKGKKCGDNSEYFKSPGDILCYPQDVTDDEIFKFRNENKIADPKAPWTPNQPFTTFK